MMILFLWFLCGVISAAFDIQYELRRGKDYTTNKLMPSFIAILFGPVLGIIFVILYLNNSKRILIKSKNYKPKKSKDDSLKSNSLED